MEFGSHFGLINLIEIPNVRFRIFFVFTKLTEPMGNECPLQSHLHLVRMSLEKSFEVTAPSLI